MGFIPANNLHPSGFYKRIFYLQYTLSFLLVPCAFMMGNTLKKDEQNIRQWDGTNFNQWLRSTQGCSEKTNFCHINAIIPNKNIKKKLCLFKKMRKNKEMAAISTLTTNKWRISMEHQRMWKIPLYWRIQGTWRGNIFLQQKELYSNL